MPVSGRVPTPAAMLSVKCCTLLVAGMAQVTVGCEITNFNKNCAQLAQAISLAHGGRGLLRSLLNMPPAANGRFTRTAMRLSAARGKSRRSASRSAME